MATAKQDANKGEAGVAVVKKYANRRLYNTATSSYVTLDQLSQMIRAGDNFVVYDAKTHEDITRSVLTQIILEEDGKGRNLLPTSFLRQLIRFYDDSLRAFVPQYLEVSMEQFALNQERMRTYVEGTLGRFFPVAQFEDMARQNIALFQRAATMFTPFPAPSEGDEAAPAGGGEPVADAGDTAAQLAELRRKVDELQQQLDQLGGKKQA